jgi:hypothetical protein
MFVQTHERYRRRRDLAFYASQIDGDPNTPGVQPYAFGPAQFDVVMTIKRKQGGDRSRTVLHVVFDVVPGPTQTS